MTPFLILVLLAPGPRAQTDPLGPAYEVYRRGRWAEAERIALSVRTDARSAAKAHLLIGYCEAWRHNTQRAREWFGRTQFEAAKLPDHGKRAAKLGESLPTIEEEAAYQHAVCSAMLREPGEAEREFLQIMRDFPESPLVHGAVKRIARLHHRDVPKEAEEAWKAAMREAKRRGEARKREESICGPECVAELMRRAYPPAPSLKGRGAVTVHGLAREMGTTHEGTSLSALADAAGRHGLRCEGLMLTPAGLERQSLPLIALVSPRHFVLVEAVSPYGVTIWDPDGRGIGKALRTQVPRSEWARRWGGVALTVAPSSPAPLSGKEKRGRSRVSRLNSD